jgi:cytoskeleton protein RodZ
MAMNFGSHLREARERRGVSLKQIAASTRISMRVLEALENNEIGKLPGGIFSRGFVRSYAHEVGLDPDETVREFVHQFPVDHDIAGPAPAGDAAPEPSDDHARRQQFRVLVACAIGIPLGALLIYFLLSARRPASTADSAPNASATTPTSQPATPTAGPAASSSTAVAPGAASPAGLPLPVAAANDPNAPLRLRIAPEGPCWVRVRVAGAVTYQALMQKGDVHSQESRDGFDILVGDTGTFRFAINDRPGRALGGSGDVTVARITRADLESWLEPAR